MKLFLLLTTFMLIATVISIHSAPSFFNKVHSINSESSLLAHGNIHLYNSNESVYSPSNDFFLYATAESIKDKITDNISVNIYLVKCRVMSGVCTKKVLETSLVQHLKDLDSEYINFNYLGNNEFTISVTTNDYNIAVERWKMTESGVLLESVYKLDKKRDIKNINSSVYIKKDKTLIFSTQNK